MRHYVEVDRKKGEIVVKNPKAEGGEQPKTYTFDQVYNWENSQMDVFEVKAAREEVQVEHTRLTVFVYSVPQCVCWCVEAEEVVQVVDCVCV